MADVVVTLRLMPESPEVDLKKVEHEAVAKIKAFSGMDNHKASAVPVAFGLKALEILFVMPESKGSTDQLEALIAKVPGVESVEVTDVRRTLG